MAWLRWRVRPRPKLLQKAGLGSCCPPPPKNFGIAAIEALAFRHTVILTPERWGIASQNWGLLVAGRAWWRATLRRWLRCSNEILMGPSVNNAAGMARPAAAETSFLLDADLHRTKKRHTPIVSMRFVEEFPACRSF